MEKWKAAMQNKISARLLFYLFLIQSQLSPIQTQAVQHYTSNPEVKFPEDFEVYDPKVDNKFRLTNSGLSGSKVIEADCRIEPEYRRMASL